MFKNINKSQARGSSFVQDRFATIEQPKISRSVFDRSSGLKTSFDAGLLIPIFCDEALPGDTINLRTNMFARLQRPLAPIMDNMYMDFFFFAVPNRLLWANWQKFMGEQDNPGDSTDFLIPRIEHGPTQELAPVSLSDYMGLPLLDPGQQGAYSAFWHRAYNLIWNEYFRSEDLQDKVVFHTDDGPDDPFDYTLLRRGKRHDYFTSSLPFAQKGDPVELTFEGVLPVTPDGTAPTMTEGFNTEAIRYVGGLTNAWGSNSTMNTGVDMEWVNTGMEADLANATTNTINQLREAWQIQRLLERDARGGTRYTELLRSHFGVISPDARLQRPEYLGGGTITINVNPVADTGNTPGSIKAFVTATAQGIGFVKSFVEHCTILGMVSARAELTYQQGMDRMWSRRTRYDYAWPSLARLGEQEVLSKEIFYDGEQNPDNEDVWGYQERYAEYRYKPSRTCATMKSSNPFTQDIYHLGLDFIGRPTLNDVFIQEFPPFDRVITVPIQHHFLADFWFSQHHARPLPVRGIPGMVDHF